MYLKCGVVWGGGEVMFSCILCYFQHFQKTNSGNKKIYFFFRKTILFKFFGNIEKCPSTYWFNGRWFPQIIARDSGNLYPIYIYKTKICGVSFWTCGCGISGDRVALSSQGFNKVTLLLQVWSFPWCSQ